MSLKEFAQNDIFRNVIEVHPQYKIKIYNGKIYINNSTDGGIKYQDGLKEPVISEVEIGLNFSYEENSQYIPLI